MQHYIRVHSWQVGPKQIFVPPVGPGLVILPCEQPVYLDTAALEIEIEMSSGRQRSKIPGQSEE